MRATTRCQSDATMEWLAEQDEKNPPPAMDAWVAAVREAQRAPWEVLSASLTADARRYGATRAHYALHVQGINHASHGARFSWTVPMPTRTGQDAMYDFSHAEMDDETRAALATVAS